MFFVRCWYPQRNNPCPEWRCWSRELAKKPKLDYIISIYAVWIWYLESLCNDMHCKVLHCIIHSVCRKLQLKVFCFTIFLWKVASFLIIHLCPVILVLKCVELLCLQENILIEVDFLGKKHFIIHWSAFGLVFFFHSVAYQHPLENACWNLGIKFCSSLLLNRFYRFSLNYSNYSNVKQNLFLNWGNPSLWGQSLAEGLWLCSPSLAQWKWLGVLQLNLGVSRWSFNCCYCTGNLGYKRVAHTS